MVKPLSLGAEDPNAYIANLKTTISSSVSHISLDQLPLVEHV